jgi:hypothetical protein
MRTAILAALALAAFSLPAIPAEKFVPLGYAYTPEKQKPPPLNSLKQRRIERADIRETEVYQWQRQRAIDRNFMVRPMGSDWSKDPFTPNY